MSAAEKYRLGRSYCKQLVLSRLMKYAKKECTIYKDKLCKREMHCDSLSKKPIIKQLLSIVIQRYFLLLLQSKLSTTELNRLSTKSSIRILLL